MDILDETRDRLKSGEYDDADIMRAWLAIDAWKNADARIVELNQAQIVGYMVHGDDITHAALYPLAQKDEAFEAARRWVRPITALVQHPNTPRLPRAGGEL